MMTRWHTFVRTRLTALAGFALLLCLALPVAAQEIPPLPLPPSSKETTPPAAEFVPFTPSVSVPAENTSREPPPAWQSGLRFQSVDDKLKLHVGGRLEFDNAWFTQDNNILMGTANDQRMQDGTLFRRARLRADGSYYDFIEFVAEVNFANIQDVSNVDNNIVQVGSVGLRDFYVGFRDIPVVGNIRVGHIRAPVGLERYSGSIASNYMERSSLYDAFLAPNDFQNGIVVFDSYCDDRITLAAAGTWIGKSTVQSFGFGNNEGKYAGSARATALPLYENEGRTFMHVGAGYFHQTLVNSSFAVANRPLLRSGAGSSETPNLLFTGTYFTPNGADLIDLEWALVHGPFSMSAEYALTNGTEIYDTLVGGVFSGPRGNVTYQAAYVEGGLFVTPGDHRSYNKKHGTWSRNVPQKDLTMQRADGRSWFEGTGAVELVARYTYLDLVSGQPTLTSPAPGANAGRQSDVTLGVNWYLNAHTWIMVNYVWTHIDSVVPGADGVLQGIGARVHIDF